MANNKKRWLIRLTACVLGLGVGPAVYAGRSGTAVVPHGGRASGDPVVIRGGVSMPPILTVGNAAIRFESGEEPQRTTPPHKYDACLPADTQWQIPVGKGESISIAASVDTFCDPRGWSTDNWSTRWGPGGQPGHLVPEALYPKAPLAMLVGAISDIDAGDSPWTEQFAKRLFSELPLKIGETFNTVSPRLGFLYIRINDAWTPASDKGAVRVKINMGGTVVEVVPRSGTWHPPAVQ